MHGSVDQSADRQDLVRETLDRLYRNESRRIFAALEQWPREGVPDNPRAWLVSTGRFKAIDHIRRRARLVEMQQAMQGVCEYRFQSNV